MPSLSSLAALSADLPMLQAPPPSPDTIKVTTTYTVSSDTDLAGDPGFKLVVKSGATTTLNIDAHATLDGGSQRSIVVAVRGSASDNGDAAINIGASGGLSVRGEGTGNVFGFFLTSVRNFDFNSQGSVDVRAPHGDAFAMNLTCDVVTFVNGATGSLYVSSKSVAAGYVIDANSGTVENDGAITVKGASAAGLLVTGVSSVQSSNFGDIIAIGNSAGLGAHVAGFEVSGGTVDNHGHVRVVGKAAVLGVQAYDHQGFTNEGHIEAISANGARDSVGLQIKTAAGALTVNSGVIRADVAIAATDAPGGNPSNHSADNVQNSGHIFGDILLGADDDSLTNTGVIRGDIDLGDGNDSFDGSSGHLHGIAYGGLGDDKLTGSGHDDSLFGDASDGSPGEGGADLLRGLGGADALSGGDGNDTLIGGSGGDTLTGGAGDDVFQFNKLSDAPGFGATDTIMDLENNDVIDLSRIDGDSVDGGFQPFHQVSSFTNNPGELTIFYDGGSGMGSIAGDTDGDGDPDFVIVVVGDHTDFTNFLL